MSVPVTLLQIVTLLFLLLIFILGSFLADNLNVLVPILAENFPITGFYSSDIFLLSNFREDQYHIVLVSQPHTYLFFYFIILSP